MNTSKWLPKQLKSADYSSKVLQKLPQDPPFQWYQAQNTFVNVHLLVQRSEMLL